MLLEDNMEEEHAFLRQAELFMKSSRRQQEVAIMANGRVDKIAMFAEVEPRPLTGAALVQAGTPR